MTAQAVNRVHIHKNLVTDINPQSPKRIAVFGSTGSVGQSTLDVARELRQRIQIVGLTAHARLAELVDQALEFRPKWIVAADEPAARRFKWPALPGTELLVGPGALDDLAAQPDVDVVLAAIVGTAGLTSTWSAVSAGKTVALANKETLVAAGPLVMDTALQTGASILPVDSEHNAIFQCLKAGNRSDVSRIYLTASGGPFRQFSSSELNLVTRQQALDHPTWDMGPKISIDSATMMNKALEIIEARWLFQLEPDQIEVVVHPQSIVHSMVEFTDGSVIAQLSKPDMKLPIQHALTWPDRLDGPAERMDFGIPFQMEFAPPDVSRFPAIALGQQVARMGGTSGAVLNAANEAAVEAFLNGRIEFTDIVRACQDILQQHPFEPQPTLDQIVAADRWARNEIGNWIVV